MEDEKSLLCDIFLLKFFSQQFVKIVFLLTVFQHTLSLD